MSQPSARERRASLLCWIHERVEHHDLTAREIADISGIYTHIQHGKADRCFDDLKVLESKGQLSRAGRPAEWYPVRTRRDAFDEARDGDGQG